MTKEEIDVIVAEKIMGLKLLPKQPNQKRQRLVQEPALCYDGEYRTFERLCPYFSSDVTQAWIVLHQARKTKTRDKRSIKIRLLPASGRWKVLINGSSAVSHSIAEAICLAAIRSYHLDPRT